jgi:hypothetical protein
MLELSGMVPLRKEMEDKPLVQFQNQTFHEENYDFEGEPNPKFQNEMGSMNTMTERLPLMPTKQALVDRASMASPLKLATPRNNYTVASKSTGEKKKKAPVSKVSVRLAPTTNLMALTDKLDQLSNKCQSRMPLNNRKMDQSKIQTKVKSRKKIL